MQNCGGWLLVVFVVLCGGVASGQGPDGPKVFGGAKAPDGPKEPVSYIELEDYRLYLGSDSNGFAVYSPRTKRWTSHNFPKHLQVKPCADGAGAGYPTGWRRGVGATLTVGPIVAFELSDAPIEELVAVDCQGRFCIHKLDAPLKQRFKPFITGSGVFYDIVDGKIYAFSGMTGTWDVLEAPEIPAPKWKDGTGTQPAIETGFEAHNDKLVVRLPFGKMTFAADQGRWKLERKPASEEVSLPAKK